MKSPHHGVGRLTGAPPIRNTSTPVPRLPGPPIFLRERIVPNRLEERLEEIFEALPVCRRRDLQLASVHHAVARGSIAAAPTGGSEAS